MMYLIQVLFLSLSFFSNLFAKEESVVKHPIVCIETTQGLIELKLNPEAAPKACENFMTLVKNHYYDGVIFHRVIKDFMVQCGDPTGTGRGGKSCWGAPFQDEVRRDIVFNKPGLLAMANAGPNTNGSQFFITTAETPWLNMHHTIFGEVITGYDIVQKIEKVRTDSQSKPEKEQRIIKAYLKE